jgi:NAD(P)-dependent dehydrogenase (short-subunit alcohol dehydrogenase family)
VKRLEGKVALITGAGRIQGIGSACALRLAREGADVVVTDIDVSGEQIPGGSQLEAVAEEISRLGVRVMSLNMDVTDPQAVQDAVGRIKEQLGRIDILVNNAGASPGPSPLTQFDLGNWEQTLKVNLTGTFLCSREVVPVMIEGGCGGKIINMSSRAARCGALWMHAYSAAKAGILGLTRSMALELAPFQICVNALCPGDIVTELKVWGWELEAQVKGKTVEELQEAVIQDTPLRRLGTPEDVAAAVAFFASPDSDFLTGEVINVTGGKNANSSRLF